MNINTICLPILGAICGDILGSSYEFSGIKNLRAPLCLPNNRITDDTVCTIAVADAIIHGLRFDDALRKWCRKYPCIGYGPAFSTWFRLENGQPYNSWGNGSAMRVSAAGALASTLNEALELAKARPKSHTITRRE